MMQEDFGLISIIMAAYNTEKTIEQAINSVLSQTYTNFELLVVNDCSTDRTAELVKSIAAKDSRVRLISNVKNSGVSYTRKHGLEEFLTAMTHGHRKNWKSRLTFREEPMLTSFLQVLLLWIRMGSQLTGIFMLLRRSRIVNC